MMLWIRHCVVSAKYIFSVSPSSHYTAAVTPSWSRFQNITVLYLGIGHQRHHVNDRTAVPAPGPPINFGILLEDRRISRVFTEAT
jgi:hypothetical protein